MTLASQSEFELFQSGDFPLNYRSYSPVSVLGVFNQKQNRGKIKLVLTTDNCYNKAHDVMCSRHANHYTYTGALLLSFLVNKFHLGTCMVMSVADSNLQLQYNM